MSRFDYVIAGSGIIGLSIALELKNQDPLAEICIIEKESDVAKHASGRNSGVIHAGFYYSPESLKAKLTRDGNIQMRNFCSDQNLPFSVCGKVVVASSPKDLQQLESLAANAEANGVEVELINEKELKKLEPAAKTFEKAIWSPNTGVADPTCVSRRLKDLLISYGVTFRFSTEVLDVSIDALQTSGGVVNFSHFINAAGLYADKIAHKFGFGSNYTMLPFLGLYYFAPQLKNAISRHIYPTPDPRYPFLGVHFTRTINGEVKVGPTAIPLLSREQYALASNFSWSEFAEILSIYPSFLASKSHNAATLIISELPKLSRKYLLSKAAILAPDIDIAKFTVSGTPGIRAQLFNRQLGKLEMDFVVEGDKSSTHILNAVSPAWTSCFSFADFVVRQIFERAGK